MRSSIRLVSAVLAFALLNLSPFASAQQSVSPQSTPTATPAATSASAPSASSSGANTMKGFEWTRVQDLKSDSRATNRPVKQKWAVVVGAAKFKEKRLDGEVQSMDKAAKQFYDYLVDPQGGRFDPSHVKLLLNAEATKQNVMSALGLTWLGSLAGPDDIVAVFFATNSFPTTDGNTYLCAYDCALDNIYSTCISIPGLMSGLRKDVKADRILLVLQACYSGAAELNSGAKALYSGYNIDLDRVVLGKGYVILSSSGPDEITYDDAFSRHLVESLRRQNGLIPLRSAFATAQKATQVDGAKQSKRQTPVMKSDWSGNDLVLGVPTVEKVSALPEGVVSFMSAESYYLKATNLANSGDFDGAVKQYELAISVDPTYADALADYGSVLALKEKLPEAAGFYQKAINVRPNDPLFHANYARILDKMGKQLEAVEQLELAYKNNPKDRLVLTALSSKEIAAGRVDRGVQLLQDACKLYPASSQLHERLSYALSKSGDSNGALNEAREAVKLDGKSPSALLNLGSSLMMHGERVPAVETYKQAIAVAPDYADAHYLLSRALEANGNRQEAIVQMHSYLQLCSPSDPRAVGVRKHLDELSAISDTSAKP